MNLNHKYTIPTALAEDNYYFADLSKIIPADKKILQKTVRHLRPNSKNYEDSWGYIIQSTRYGGFKWYNPKTGSLIFFGRKSATDPTLVVPSYFVSPENLAHIIHKIEISFNVFHTIIKNVNSEEIGTFTPYGFRPYKKTEGWVPVARFDDQTYPQLIVNLKKTVEAQGTHFQNLRTTLNKKPSLEMRRYRDSNRDAVLKLLIMKDSMINKNFDTLNGMYYVSHAMYPDADVDKYVIIDKNTQEILGFTATSKITTEDTTLIASIFKPGARIASIWGIYKTIETKYKEGYVRINLGGNESKETFNFMQEKFRPVEVLYKTHLVYNP